LRADINAWGRIAASHDYPYGSGPLGDSVTVKAKIRVDGASPANGGVEVCSIAYLEADSNPRSACQEFPVSQNIADVFLTLDTGRQQLDRVFFQLKRADSGTATVTVDATHLYVVQQVVAGGTPTPSPTATPGPTSSPGPTATPGPTSSPTPTATPDPVGDLETVGFALRPTHYRSMTAEMDLRNDVSSAGAAVNTAPKDVLVRLTPSVDAVGQTQRVSFGFPLPPSTLVNTDNIRVTNSAGQEIPAFIRSLGAWEHMPDQRLLCGGLMASGNPGIRSVLIQFDMAFADASPVTMTVGVNRARSMNLATEVPVRESYRVVNDGTYAPSVNTSGLTIREPNVLSAVDHRYLACTNVFPMVNTTGSRPYLASSDQATDDFFYSQINQHWKKQSWAVTSAEDIVNFYTDSEPWLYDRAGGFYNSYFRSGNADMLREAHRAADHYAQNIYGPEDCASTYYPYCVGSFKLKNTDPLYPYPDVKYSYSESLLSNYLLTGDATVLKKIGYISWFMEFHVGLTGTVDTERGLGFALLAHAVDAELTGSIHQRSVVDEGVNAMRARQTSPLDGNAPNGCFNYPPEGQTHTFSPWMSSLLAHGFLRSYQATSHASVPPALVDLGQCEITRGMAALQPGESGPMSVGRYYPYYIAYSFGTPGDADGFNPWNGFEHAIDVAIPVSLGAYFSTDASQKATLSNLAKELLLTHDESIAYWTRDGADTQAAGRSKYRVSPPRKWLWQYKNAAVIGSALDGPSTW
ncbi:MAG: hypothetical protein PHT19_17705, partial [Methylococcus sp.]|nr:hypothetical protein [Methylococcus sp.]